MRDYLKLLRINYHLTQNDVAKKIGVTGNYYNMIENGNRQKNITLDLLKKLANAFGVPFSEIIDCEINYKAGLHS